jgi:hypothetical protein
MDIKWWIIVLPGDHVGSSYYFGPFRSKVDADAAAEKWNADNHDDPCMVLPLRPCGDFKAGI